MSGAPPTGRFVLTVPPDFNFKGDPPHWIRQLFLEPLLDGWRREIVIRTTPMKNKRADVYYYSPDGTKFRSRREIGQYLQDNGITKYSAVFNFWFNGKLLGGEFEPYETLRPSHIHHSQQASSSSPKSSSYEEPADIIYDEEIEINSEGQLRVFDPAALSSLGDADVPFTLPIVREERTRFATYPVKKRKAGISETSSIPKKKSKGTKKYCICEDVEHGNMVLCDNEKCELGWYHFSCVNLKEKPIGAWYCPICRGNTYDVINLGNEQIEPDEKKLQREHCEK